MDFGHHNIQRISKAFTLTPNNNVDDPCISLWNKTTLTLLKTKKPEYYNVICSVIDRMGEASAKAQVLPTAITTSSKIQFNDNNLYLYSVDNKVYGILKVGKKKLFYRSMTGDFKEIEPLCVLDFYISEAVQRKGIGKILFEAMIAFEKTSPESFAYDRPSPKLIGFLRRHYGLSDFIPQSNNFVVFKQYFMSGVPVLVPNPTITSSKELVPSQRSPIKTNQISSDQQIYETPTKIHKNNIEFGSGSRNNQSNNKNEYYSPQTKFSPQNQKSPQHHSYGNSKSSFQSPIQNMYSTPPQPPQVNRSPTSFNKAAVNASPFNSPYPQGSFASPSPNKRFVQYNPITHECAEVERNGDSRKTGKKVSQLPVSKENNIASFNALGFIYYKIGDLQSSMNNFVKSKELIIGKKTTTKELYLKEDILVTNNIGVVQLHRGEIEKSIDSFMYSLQKSQQINNSGKEVLIINPLLNLGYLYLRILNDTDKAEGYLLNVIRQTDSNFDAWIGLSEIYMIHEEYQEAIQCCYKAKKCDPNNTSYLLMLALIKHNMGWDAEAIHLLDEMKQRDPNNPSLYHLFGIIYKERCLYKQSIESFMKGLELAPYQIISIENIVDIYWETGNYDLANNVITKALELFSGQDCLSMLEYKKSVLDSVLLSPQDGDPKSSLMNTFEKYCLNNKSQQQQFLGFNQLPLGFRSIAVEKAAFNNISLLKYYNGDTEGALIYLLNAFNIEPSIFTQEVYTNSNIQLLYSLYPQTLRLLWFYLTKLGCSKTSLILMQLMYDRHTMIGKKPGGKDASTIFWYYIALASAGNPWKLLDYSKWIFDEISKRDDAPFYMQVYAYNRMERSIMEDRSGSGSGEKVMMNLELRTHVENCLKESTRNGNLTAIDYEKALYHYNIEDYNNATLSMPKVSNFSELSPEFQLLQAKILYKKKSSISSRQALQILSNLQRSSPKNYEYVYLRLKLFYILDDSNFASVYRDFNPIAMEFQVKKLKLGTKYYVNHFDIEKSRNELEKLEKLVDSIPEWKKSNKIEKSEVFNTKHWKSSIYFLKANISYISNESYFSTMNSMHSISEQYMKKPKAIIFELKFSQRSPSSQYYQNQFYEKAQQALKQIDPKFQSTCWQWIIIYLLSNGMKKQAMIVSNNMGSTRFARIDTLYPLCKISFMIGLNDNLESYLSKLDLSIIKMQAKSIETRQLLSEFDLFKVRVTANKFNRSNLSNNEFSLLVDEFKMNFNNLWSYLSYLKGLYKESLIDILSSYLSFIGKSSITTNSNDNFIQRIIQEAPDIIPYSKYLLDKSIREDERKKYFDLLLKSYSETINSDKKINYQLLETLKKGDLSFLNSREMNTVSDLTNFARQINNAAATYENVIMKMIGESKVFTTERMQVMELVLKDYASPLCLQWIRYELSKRNQKTPFFNLLQGGSSGEISNSSSRNIFSSIEKLESNVNIDYVKAIETLTNRHQEPIIQSHAILLHIMKLSQSKSKLGGTDDLESSPELWYLKHDNLLSFVNDFIERNTDAVEIEHGNDDDGDEQSHSSSEATKENETLPIILNEEFDNKYIHGKKNSLFWKCIHYIFNDPSNDELIKERLELICEQTNNVDDLSINMDFILHEWSIKDESLNFRLKKIQEKTCGEFLSLFYTMLSDIYSNVEKDHVVVLNFVQNQLLKQVKTTIRKSKNTSWKEFIEFINNPIIANEEEESTVSETATVSSHFNLRKISVNNNGIVDWRICYALLIDSRRENLPDHVSFSLMTMMLESVVILFSSSVVTSPTTTTTSNKYSERVFKIEEILSQLCSNMCPSSFGSFTYQLIDESSTVAEVQKPSVYYCTRLILNDFLEILSNMKKDNPIIKQILKQSINILSYLIEYKFIEKDAFESALFCTKWAKICSFIVETFSGVELTRLTCLFFFKNSYKSIQKYSALEIPNFVMEFLRLCNNDSFEKFMNVVVCVEDAKFKSIHSSLSVVNNVLYNNLNSTVLKDDFFNSLIEVFKNLGKTISSSDHTLKWMQFVNSIDISKISYGNSTNAMMNHLWEMKLGIDRDYEQDDSKESTTITLTPIPTLNSTHLETLTLNAIQNLVEIDKLALTPILKIGRVFFKVIYRKQSLLNSSSSSSFSSRDLQTVKSLDFSTLKKPGHLLYQYFMQYASQKQAAMSYDVETKKKNTVIVTKYYIYKNSWYEKCEALVRDLAKWSALSWFFGLSSVDDSSITIDLEKGRVIFDNLSCVFNQATRREYAAPFRLDLDFQVLLQNMNLSHCFESEFEKCLNHLLTPFNIQMVTGLAKKLISLNCQLEYPSSATGFKKMPVFVFEDLYRRNDSTTTGSTLTADRYLFELLKRNFKLERQLTKSSLSNVERTTSAARSTPAVVNNQNKQENTNPIIHPASTFNETILDLLYKRLNGWVILANSLKQQERESSTTDHSSINFETCGLKCNNITQLSMELITQAKIFSSK